MKQINEKLLTHRYFQFITNIAQQCTLCVSVKILDEKPAVEDKIEEDGDKKMDK